MSELAFNINGEPFEVSPLVAWWRVRRMSGGKGAPAVAYGKSGTPLVLPVDAGIDDLRNAVETAGRYRLDPLDEEHKPVADVPPAYVYVHADAGLATTTSGGSISMAQLALEAIKSNREAMQLNREAMEVICEQSTRVIDRFTQVMEQTSVMIGAAHGVGLTTRPPRVIDVGAVESPEDDEDVETEEIVLEDAQKPTPGGVDWNAFARQVWPYVKPLGPIAFAFVAAKAPHLAPYLEAVGLGPRRASKPIKLEPAAEPPKVEPEATPAAPAEESFQPTPAMFAHLMAIQAALQPDELVIVKGVIADMAPPDRMAWIRQLSALDVQAAVTEIRKHLNAGKAGGVS